MDTEYTSIGIVYGIKKRVIKFRNHMFGTYRLISIFNLIDNNNQPPSLILLTFEDSVGNYENYLPSFN